ncbi:hypothetical protein [Amycolatopsis sp. BJA-103]|nr:hypothetical protein [Amycolatopsis sp. BJA-103]
MPAHPLAGILVRAAHGPVLVLPAPSFPQLTRCAEVGTYRIVGKRSSEGRPVQPRNTIFLEMIERTGTTTFGSSTFTNLYAAFAMRWNQDSA